MRYQPQWWSPRRNALPGPKRALAATTGKRKGPNTTFRNGTFSLLLDAAQPPKKTKTRTVAAAAAERVQQLVATSTCQRQVLASSIASRCPFHKFSAALSNLWGAPFFPLPIVCLFFFFFFCLFSSYPSLECAHTTHLMSTLLYTLSGQQRPCSDLPPVVRPLAALVRSQLLERAHPSLGSGETRVHSYGEAS